MIVFPLILALVMLSQPPVKAVKATPKTVKTPAVVQPVAQPLCTAADRFLRENQQLVTVVEPDTMDDWRTKQRLVGCKITAAGGTTRGVQPQAVAFYEAVRAAGWTRTPDPRDAPTEASLRFRWEQSDCLFNVFGPPMLNTDAEAVVNERRPLASGEVRWHVYASCLPALPAAPR